MLLVSLQDMSNNITEELIEQFLKEKGGWREFIDEKMQDNLNASLEAIYVCNIDELKNKTFLFDFDISYKILEEEKQAQGSAKISLDDNLNILNIEKL